MRPLARQQRAFRSWLAVFAEICLSNELRKATTSCFVISRIGSIGTIAKELHKLIQAAAVKGHRGSGGLRLLGLQPQLLLKWLRLSGASDSPSDR
jgi:hypothetical protein